VTRMLFTALPMSLLVSFAALAQSTQPTDSQRNRSGTFQSGILCTEFGPIGVSFRRDLNSRDFAQSDVRQRQPETVFCGGGEGRHRARRRTP